MSYASEVSIDAPSGWWRFIESSSPYIDLIGGATLVKNDTDDPNQIATPIAGDTADFSLEFVHHAIEQHLASADFFPDLSGQNLSVEFWIRPDDNSLGPYWEVGPGDSYFFFWIEADGSASCGIRQGWDRFEPLIDIPAGTFVEGAWHHVVYTRAADGTAKMYVNAVLIASGNHPDVISSTTFYIGLGSFSGKEQAVGGFDELAIYNHVLLPDRVAAHYGAVLDTSLTYVELVMSDAPEAYWRFGEYAGDVAVDYTGNGHSAAYSFDQRKGYPGAIFADINTSVAFGDIEIAHYNPNDFVTLPNDALPTNVPLTIEGWFYFDPTFAPIDQRLWSITDAGTSDEITLLMTNPSTGNLILRCKIGFTTTELVVPFSPGHSKWHHIVAFVAGIGATSRLYLDGVQVANGAGFDLSPYASWFYLGWVFPYDYAPPEKFLGAADEVAVYHHELVAADVWAHYTMGKSGAGEAAMEGFSSISFSASPALLTVPVVLSGVDQIVFVGASPALSNDSSISQRLFPLPTRITFAASMPVLSAIMSLSGSASIAFDIIPPNVELGVYVTVDPEHATIVFGSSSPELATESSFVGTAAMTFSASSPNLSSVNGLDGTASLVMTALPATLAVIRNLQSDNTEATIKFSQRGALNALMVESSAVITFTAAAELRATLALAGESSVNFAASSPGMIYGAAGLSGLATLAISAQTANLSGTVNLFGACAIQFASSMPSIDGVIAATGGAFHRSKIRRPR